VIAIASSGTIQSNRAAWSYLRSESAKFEAQIVDVSNKTQGDIISAIGKMKPTDLETYNTKKTIDAVNKTLSHMVGDCSILAREMVTANILAGKLKVIERYNLKDKKFEDAVLLNDTDRARIERMVNEVIARIQRGASLTLSSVTSMLQNTAIRANMQPGLSKTKDDGKDKDKTKDKDVAKQTPMSKEFIGELVEPDKPRKAYVISMPTAKELENISKDPIKFASSTTKANGDFVKTLRDDYFRESVIRNSEKRREKAIDEAKGTPAEKALFDLNKMLRTQGLFAFTDAGGKRWTLVNYCSMSARTTSAQSTNFGEVFADEKHDLYYIVPHSHSCPICAKYEGRVYSRSGKNKRYPALSSVFGKIDPNGSDDLDNTYLTIHPNCRHKIIRYYERSQTKQKRIEMRQKSNAPFELSEQKQKEIKQYKERERVYSDRLAAMREFQMYLQVLPAKDVCGNFIKFYEHKQKNDYAYKEVKRKYEEATIGKPRKNSKVR
jgi:hypothetical protein